MRTATCLIVVFYSLLAVFAGSAAPKSDSSLLSDLDSLPARLPADSSILPKQLYRLAPLLNAGYDAGYDLLDSITPWTYRLRRRLSGTKLGHLLRVNDTISSRSGSDRFSRLSDIIFGRNIPLGKRLMIGVDGLAFMFPEVNPVDGLWCGYEIYSAFTPRSGVKLSARTNVYYTTRRHRPVFHTYFSLHYAPARNGLLMFGAGRSTADVNLLNGEQIYLEEYASPPPGNTPVRYYERGWALIRNNADVLPRLRLDLTLLYENRRPVSPKAEFGRHRALTYEVQIRVRTSPYRAISPAGGGTYLSPTGFGGPDVFIAYRQALPLRNTPEAAWVDYSRLELLLRGSLSIVPKARLFYLVGGGSYFHRTRLAEIDEKMFPTTHTVTFMPQLFSYGALYPRYDAGKHWLEMQATLMTSSLLLGRIRSSRALPFDEALLLRAIVPTTDHRPPYVEIGYSVGWSSLLRIGCFFGFERDRYAGAAVRVSLPIVQLLRTWSERSFSPVGL